MDDLRELGLLVHDLGLVIFGVIMGLVPGWYTRRRRLRTHWSALRAEMDLCKEKAEILFGKPYLAPLYRLPLLAFQASLPILLADGALSEDESKVLSRFFSQVQDINRGLDNAGEMYKGDNPRLMDEYKRNKLKAEALVHADGESMYDAARKIVDHKLTGRWWKYTPTT